MPNTGMKDTRVFVCDNRSSASLIFYHQSSDRRIAIVRGKIIAIEREKNFRCYFIIVVHTWGGLLNNNDAVVVNNWVRANLLRKSRMNVAGKDRHYGMASDFFLECILQSCIVR